MLHACKKIILGLRANFRDKNKCFVHVLFSVRAILRRILTSGKLHRNFNFSIHSADACILAMSCVDLRARG